MKRVFKIGGSIFSSLELLVRIAKKIAESDLIDNSVFVVSAFKNYTDDLIKMNQFFSEEHCSFLITSGEQIAAGLFAMALRRYGKKAVPLAAWQIDLREQGGNFSLNSPKILSLLEKDIVPVVAGFQCINENSEISNLGRGGSDLTAILIASNIDAECILVKDSGGVRSVDPALLDGSFVWKNVDYDNMINLSKAGCRLVQLKALEIAKERKVKLHIADVELFNQTSVSREVNDFWSLLKHNDGIRLVSRRKDMINKYWGPMCKNSEDFFFDFNSSNVKMDARKIYEVCLQMFK
jgi:aspartokinase